MQSQLIDLLMQGSTSWNCWKEEHPLVQINLAKINLAGKNYSKVNLTKASLCEANLSKMDLSGARLDGTNLSGADLSDIDLSGADLSDANLSGADLRGADLSKVNFYRANLSNANLSDTYLYRTDFSDANLSEANFSDARAGWSILGNVDLHLVKGLETVKHEGPSYISTSTLSRSGGNIPVSFLQGAGLNDGFISYTRSLSDLPTRYSTCFISYASQERIFAASLYTDLQNSGVRCWHAPHSTKMSFGVFPRIDESSRLYDKLLLVLSHHSLADDRWIRPEIERTLAKEQEEQRNVLLLLLMDRSILARELAQNIPNIQNKHYIADFEQWEKPEEYQKSFSQLLHTLQRV